MIGDIRLNDFEKYFCFKILTQSEKGTKFEKVIAMINSTTEPNTILSYDIKGLVKASGRSRSSIFADIAAGRLIARKAGRRTIILYEDAVAWLKALPIRGVSRSCLSAATAG